MLKRVYSKPSDSCVTDGLLFDSSRPGKQLKVHDIRIQNYYFPPGSEITIKLHNVAVYGQSRQDFTKVRHLIKHARLELHGTIFLK